MAYKTLARAVAVVVIATAMATVHGEGSNRPSMQSELAKARAALARVEAELAATGKSMAAKAAAVKAILRPEAAEATLSLPNGCPANADEWNDWRDATRRFLLQTEPPVKSDRSRQRWLDPDKVSTRSSQILVALDACKALNAEPPPTLMVNLLRFVRTQANANYNVPNPQHQLGHGITDDDYLVRARSALELPCLLRSQPFLQDMSSTSTYGDALKLINDRAIPSECVGDPSAHVTQTWQTLLYRSRFLTTPDDAGALGRLLVIVPAEPAASAASASQGHDRWVQFGIWTPEDKQFRTDDTPIRNVSIVSIATGDIETPVHGVKPFDAMIDWFRCNDDRCAGLRQDTAATLAHERFVASPASAPLSSAKTSKASVSKQIYLVSRLAAIGESENCSACHKMVPQSIHPEFRWRLDGSMAQSVYDFVGGQMVKLDAKAASAAVGRIDSYIESYYDRPPMWRVGDDDKFDDPMDNGGYPFGADTHHYGLKERDPDNLRACAGPAVSSSPTQLRTLATSMNCARCHNGTSRYGILNYPLATEKRPVVKHMITGPDAVSSRNLIKAYIEDGIMPPGQSRHRPSEQVKNERKALYNCLSKEYFDADAQTGLFVDWLLADGDNGRGRSTSAPPTLIRATTPKAAR